MGREATCRVDFGKQSCEGKALLETDEIIFRGDFRLKIPHKAITRLDATGGKLKVIYAEGTAVFHLGPAAQKWADKILHPPSRLDKLGVKAGTKVAVVGALDDDFLRELDERGAATIKAGADITFLAANRMSDLERLRRLETPVVWVIYPKGVKSITENQVLSAGRATGLVDVKVVSFSSTHTGLRFARRKATEPRASASGRQ